MKLKINIACKRIYNFNLLYINTSFTIYICNRYYICHYCYNCGNQKSTTIYTCIHELNVIEKTINKTLLGEKRKSIHRHNI